MTTMTTLVVLKRRLFPKPAIVSFSRRRTARRHLLCQRGRASVLNKHWHANVVVVVIIVIDVVLLLLDDVVVEAIAPLTTGRR